MRVYKPFKVVLLSFCQKKKLVCYLFLHLLFLNGLVQELGQPCMKDGQFSFLTIILHIHVFKSEKKKNDKNHLHSCRTGKYWPFCHFNCLLMYLGF